MTTSAGLTREQLMRLVAIADGHDVEAVDLIDLGLVDGERRLTIAGQAVLPPILPRFDVEMKSLISEVEADDRAA